MDKLFFIEGLPGTGKTTITEWFKKDLERKGAKVTCLLENNLQIPTNFFHIASIPEGEFQRLTGEYPAIADIAVQVEGYFFIFIDHAPNEARQELLVYDIGDEFNPHFTAESYMAQTLLYIDRKFRELSEIDGILIIDSGFLQNPINEVLFRKGTVTQAKDYIFTMAKLLQPYDFLCIYLDRGDADVSMACAKKIKGEFWYNRVMEKMKAMGMLDHFQRRYLIETGIIYDQLQSNRKI